MPGWVSWSRKHLIQTPTLQCGHGFVSLKPCSNMLWARRGRCMSCAGLRRRPSERRGEELVLVCMLWTKRSTCWSARLRLRAVFRQELGLGCFLFWASLHESAWFRTCLSIFPGDVGFGTCQLYMGLPLRRRKASVASRLPVGKMRDRELETWFWCRRSSGSKIKGITV